MSGLIIHSNESLEFEAYVNCSKYLHDFPLVSVLFVGTVLPAVCELYCRRVFWRTCMPFQVNKPGITAIEVPRTRVPKI